MARRKRFRTQIRAASDDEVANLRYWYDLAGVDDSGGTEALVDAHRRGVLGAAIGCSPDEAIAYIATCIAENRFMDAVAARSFMRTVTVDGAVAGISLAGPSPAVLSRVEHTPDLAALGLLGLSKLHVLAIAPEHRGHRLGSRMIGDAIECAASNGFAQMYGAYDSAKSSLTRFYRQHGFEVAQAGAPLNLWLTFGRNVYVTPGEGEAYFSRDFG